MVAISSQVEVDWDDVQGPHDGEYPRCGATVIVFPRRRRVGLYMVPLAMLGCTFC